MKRLVILAVLLSGCVSFEVYEPKGSLRTERAGSSCGQPMISSVQLLPDGVTLYTTVTRLGSMTSGSLSLGIPAGKRAGLSTSRITVSAGNEKPVTYTLSDFVSGAHNPPQRFPVDGVIVGTDRAARLSPPYGPLERFHSSFTLEGPAASELLVSPPKIRIDTVEIEPTPTRFVLTKASSVCVQ